MPLVTVRNEAYRDAAVKYAFPFDANSELEDEHVYIGTDLVIDAAFFFKDPTVTLPVHLSLVDGTVGEQQDVGLWLSDDAGAFVASGSIKWRRVARSCTDTLVVEAYSPKGVFTGLLVFDRVSLLRFMGRVAGEFYEMLPGVATLVVDTCHVSGAEHLRYIETDENTVTGDIRIVAGHGLAFRQNNGVLQLDMVGDTPEDATPLLQTINGVRHPSIWLAIHPQLNVRIDSTGDTLRFVDVRDTP